MARGKHSAPKRPRTRVRRHRRWPWIAAAAVVVAGVMAGGTAYAAYRYDQRSRDKILDGVQVAGVTVSGMTREEALAVVKARFEEEFSRQITVKAADKTWKITPAEMGAKAPYEAEVDKAVALTDGYDWTERVWRRMNHRSENAAFNATVTMDPEKIKAFVAKVSGAVGVSPANGGLRLEGNEIKFVKSKNGRELDSAKALFKVRAALREHTKNVKLPTNKVPPKVTGTNQKTIVVDLGENRLYLYEGKKIDRKYSVATGAPGFPTPDGSFEIVEKRKNPTWTNPDPTGWGASMPAEIPPGPGNPLGTRAMNLNAPGIRIHGTSDIASLGSAASHGCIRMAMPDVEQLYNLVDVGTAVLIKK